MKAILAGVVALFCMGAFAEEKNCTVKGMNCDHCVGTVKEKVCNDQYETCEVTVQDAKAKVGMIHVVTKDKAAKIDEKAMGTAIADTSYTIGKCSNGAPKAGKAKKAS